MDARKEREVAFHNFRFSTGMRGEDEKQSDGVEKFYSIAEASRMFYIRTIRDGCKDKRVLEYGCGTGSNAFNLGMREARVTGIDISDVAVGVAQERAQQMGLANVDFQVMDAETLKFPDSTFDLICGGAILHHLDLAKAIPELARTLKPDGKGVFVEPLGHNPVFNLYRRLTPNVRTPDEHPLLMRDFRLARTYFGKIEMRCFHLMSLAAVPLRKRGCFGRVLGWLDGLDAGLFKVVPFAKRYAWTAVITFAQPIRPATHGV